MNNIGEFLIDLSQTYPVTRGVNAEKVIEDARTYLVGKLYKKEIDFQKAKTLIFDNYDKHIFPEPKLLYHYLAQCEVKNYSESEGEGNLVVMTLPSGRKYTFTICGIGNSIYSIKESVKEKYGEYLKVEIYPAGAVMVGNEIIY